MARTLTRTEYNRMKQHAYAGSNGDGTAWALFLEDAGTTLHTDVQIVDECMCPGDCNCRQQGAPYFRTNYCGCKRHA